MGSTWCDAGASQVPEKDRLQGASSVELGFQLKLGGVSLGAGTLSQRPWAQSWSR